MQKKQQKWHVLWQLIYGIINQLIKFHCVCPWHVQSKRRVCAKSCFQLIERNHLITCLVKDNYSSTSITPVSRQRNDYLKEREFLCTPIKTSTCSSSPSSTTCCLLQLITNYMTGRLIFQKNAKQIKGCATTVALFVFLKKQYDRLYFTSSSCNISFFRAKQ